jgi:4-hydroxy-tetrahydrodipicolinate reductase
MSIKIAIAGAGGRMGQALLREAGDAFVGGTERPGSPHLGGVIVERPTLAAANADIWIDFTFPAVALASLDALKDTPLKAAILGATGWTPDQDAAVRAHAARLPIVKAGNFSLGLNVLLGLVEQAAARLGQDWDIDIAETHHRHKIDAPSGAALMIGEAAAKGRGAALADLRTPPYDGVTGERASGRIGFASRRVGGVIGDHEAVFGSEAELLVLGHRALDRSIFARGAIHAARWAIGKPPGLYSMRDVLAL